MEKQKEKIPLKQRKKGERGITLIALVITIIVLLILAAVSIAMLTGENGILTQANEAKEKTEQAEKDEKTNLGQTEDIINEYVNGIVVEQVTDTNPGVLEGNGTEDNPYVINSIEDLVFFAHNVTDGNTYDEEYVSLGLSLDFNSTKSYVDAYRTNYGIYGYDGELKKLLTSGEGFKPIGKTSNINTEPYSFAGTFDGNNNEIIGLYINTEQIPNEEKRIGLFANNYGVIQRLGIINGNISITMNSVTCDIGSITAKNYNQVSDCYCYTNINMYLQDSITGLVRGGGICSGSESGSIIENSYHSGKIYLEGNTTANIVIGGISSGTMGEVTKSFSRGNIEINTHNNGTVQIGGILGTLGGDINNCYNKKTITVESYSGQSAFIGGIIGKINSGTINLCYNSGKIEGVGNLINTKIGSIVGQTTVNIEKCYYLTGTSENGVGSNYSPSLEHNIVEKTEEQMKNNEFLNLLNQNNENIWKADSNNSNNGYPILYWEDSE